MIPNLMLRWRFFATPFALAIVSLIAAVALWVAVTEAENPTEVRDFSGSLEVHPVNIPDGRAVASIQDSVVFVRISGPENVLDRVTTADFRAEVNLAGVQQAVSERRVFVNVVSDRDIEIVEVIPSVVTVTLESLTTKTVPVRPNLLGTPPQGFDAEEQQVEASPASVRVSGAESLVRLVSHAAADINLTGLRVTLRQSYPLVPQDARGARVSGVSVEPASSEIRVPISELSITRAVTVVPPVQGVLADGYNLVAMSVDPPAIAVSGPLEALQAIQFIATEPVDVTGLRQDSVRTVRMILPAGVQSARDTVSVRLNVEPAQGEITLAITPQVANVPEGLRTVLQTPIVNIVLAGELPTLRSLTSSNVRATVSLSGLSEGVHVLNPSVSVPEGVRLVSVEPGQVTVSLQR